jgi:hypothetical protein
MDLDVLFAMSLSIVIPGVVGLSRFRKIAEIYYPFILLLCVGMINEAISFLLIKNNEPNAINSNIYLLIETIAILYQFNSWKLFKHINHFTFLVICISILWISENLVFGNINQFCSYFIILHAFLIVLLSIGMVSNLVGSISGTLLIHPIFLICCCNVVYFSTALLVEFFYVYGQSSSNEFQIAVTNISAIINVMINLVFTFAILWIPKKRGYSF